MIKPIHLWEISYPVFKLGKDLPTILPSGRVQYSFQYRLDDESNVYSTLVVDDRSLPGKTLGVRRLSLSASGITLYNLSTAIYFLSDLLKIAAGKMLFIDSSGNIFSFKKSKRVPLVFRKITNIIPINTGGAIIEADGVPGRFKTMFMPSEPVTQAGFLKLGLAYILYGLYDSSPRVESFRLI